MYKRSPVPEKTPLSARVLDLPQLVGDQAEETAMSLEGCGQSMRPTPGVADRPDVSSKP